MTSFHSPAEREKDDISQANVHVRNILRNNREWVKDQIKLDPDCFKKLGKGQRPKYLYFGCSDSRVPANQILGLG